MAKIALNQTELKDIEACLSLCQDNQRQFVSFASGLVGNIRTHPSLERHIHFIKYRVKDIDHLRRKLEKKALQRKVLLKNKAAQVPATITPDNLFEQINDLIGVRIIHLSTEQMSEIHGGLNAFFEEQQFRLVENPTADCWDNEYREFYAKLGITTRDTAGYSSVHYVIEDEFKTKWTCEIQVRTLTDEVWGEVSHIVNYPGLSPSQVCREQLKTLARFTTGCTRLVDTIFASDRDARSTKH